MPQALIPIAVAAIGAGASAVQANKQRKAQSAIAANQKRQADLARASEVRAAKQAEEAEDSRQRLARAEAQKQVSGQLSQRDISAPNIGQDISNAVLNESTVG